MTSESKTEPGGPVHWSHFVGAGLGLALLLIVMACASGEPIDQPGTAGADPAHPLALVYRGPGGCPSCSEAAAELVRGTAWDFEVRYIGPEEDLQLTAANLQTADLYVQPGGDGTLEQAFTALGPSAADIREFVASGGRYLGLCMGGYLAGSNPAGQPPGQGGPDAA
jgi:hypothetical protein